MGLFDKIFKKQNPALREAETYFRTLTAYQPVFNSWKGQVYESLMVRAAIDARARHISKLKVSVIGSAKPKLQRRLAKAPNSWQVWSQFLYRASTILDMQNTLFIVPVFDEYDEQVGFFPVLPSRCAVVDYKDEPWLRYQFSNGEKAAVEMARCVVMTKFQYQDDFFGEDNRALDPTLSLIDLQNQGLSEAIKNSATFRFMARLENFSSAKDLENDRKNFNKSNFASDDGGGLLLFPNTFGDIRQIETKPYTIPKDEVDHIKNNVFNYFAVNEDILQSKALGDSLDAFFNGAIEPFMIQFSETMTATTFSQGEMANGAGIIATANRLMYMSISSKIELARELGDRGMITINEIRELFNYTPLAEGGDKAPIRGEYKYVGEEDKGKEDE